jgi:hemerythrin-like domain-containing protein
LTNYVDLLQNHIKKEENILFPMANKVLSEEKQNEIFEEFEKIEEEAAGHDVLNGIIYCFAPEKQLSLLSG